MMSLRTFAKYCASLLVALVFNRIACGAIACPSGSDEWFAIVNGGTTSAGSQLLYATHTALSGVGELISYEVNADGKSSRLWTADYSASSGSLPDGGPSALGRTQLSSKTSLLHEKDEPALIADDGHQTIERSVMPVLVRAPNFTYEDHFETPAYSAFVRQHATRASMLYVGTADGTVLAFDARSGRQVFSFSPEASPSLHDGLPARAHQATIVASGDAVIDGAWRTILVAASGSQVNALDISDPAVSTAEKSKIAPLLLWRFVDDDLNVSYTRAAIAKLHSGQWAAIFGNGPAATGSSRDATLYIVALTDGKLIRKISIPSLAGALDQGATWPNGLSAPAAADIEGDHLVDYVYAGDLRGNLWKFDLTASAVSQWSVAFGGRPLARTRDSDGQVQPILFRPEVTRGPQGIGTAVLVGAGDDGSIADLGATNRTQTLYGIMDAGNPVSGREQLRKLQITARRSANQDGVRMITPEDDSAKQGWYLDLAVPSGEPRSERLATQPALRDGRLWFITQSTVGGCAIAETWLMALNPLYGSSSSVRAKGERADVDGASSPNSDVRIGTDAARAETQPDGLLLPSAERFALAPVAVVVGQDPDGRCLQRTYFSKDNGNIGQAAVNCRATLGRQLWRQLR